MEAGSIPLTVVGGYLGAGKTTLVNHLLSNPDGRRIGVIVNDFGALAIDEGLLAAATDDDDVISLPNGCVCCTIGAGLHEALATLSSRVPAPDHVVIEVSGVADPVVAAAWGTVPPFLPGGVIVLAAADSVQSMAKDKYVGGEVLRQLAGADLLLVTKVDLVGSDALDAADRWLESASGGAPRLSVVDGAIPTDIVLGLRPDRVVEHRIDAEHTGRYATWSWTSGQPVSRDALDSFLVRLPPEVLRLKGFVNLIDGSAVQVQVVGRRREVTSSVDSTPRDSALVAIGLSVDSPGRTLDLVGPI